MDGAGFKKLAWRNASVFLEHRGEVLRAGKAENAGNLGKLHLLRGDIADGAVDFGDADVSVYGDVDAFFEDLR